MKIGYMHLAIVLRCEGRRRGGAIRVMRGGDGRTERAARAWIAGAACCSRRSGGRQEAVTVLEQYEESEDPETLNALGIVLADAGRPAEALPSSRACSRSIPPTPTAYQNTGIALLKLDRAEEARQNLEAALKLGKRHARAWNALGVAWLQLGDPKKAIAAWEQLHRS